MCNSYCSHGGVCVLDAGHKGKHDSKWCQWTDEQAISEDDANQEYMRIATEKGMAREGRAFLEMFDLL